MNLRVLLQGLREGAEQSTKSVAQATKDIRQGPVKRFRDAYLGIEEKMKPAEKFRQNATSLERVVERSAFWAIPGYGLYQLGKSHGSPPSAPRLGSDSYSQISPTTYPY